MFFIVFIGVFTFFLAHQFYFRRRKFPPGPTPLPLIGNFKELSEHEPGYGAFAKWTKEFGSVYTVWLGFQPVVVFTDFEVIKRSFIQKGERFTNKWQIELISKEYRGGHYGVVDTNGEMWKTHRRFALHQLRDLGMGTNIMEEKIIREAEAITDILKEQGPMIPSMQNILDCAVGSIVNQLLFGYRFDESRKDELLKIKKLVAEQMRMFAEPKFLIIMTFPILRYFPYFKQVYEELFEGRDELFDIFNKQIEVHRAKIEKKSSDEEVSDYVEAFVHEQQRREGEGDKESFCDAQLSNMCYDLWVAGLDTTSNTLAWLIVYILHHPEVQEKLHEEFDQVIGDSRPICMSDKNNLPYTNAVINETQRLANLVPINLIHEMDQDFHIDGKTILAGTPVIAQISNVLYDEKIFPEPYEFRPERFIDELGKLRKVEQLVPFSIGKRQCLGEGLARMELFLFSANILNRFTFEADVVAPSIKKKFGTTMSPSESHCKVSYRF